MSIDVRRIACVVVLYKPSRSILDFITEFSNFGYQMVLVNNSCDLDLLTDLSELSNVDVLGEGSNVGLAAALNIGMEFSFEKLFCNWTILFDQDSSPNSEMPRDMVIELSDIANNQIASISPSLIDQKAFSAVCTTPTIFSKTRPGSAPTSGTLITQWAWQKVGPMLEGLFIDGIDHEWCFRSCSKGFKVMISSRQTMIHNMGEFGFNFFGKYKPIHRSPLRHYFIVRNTIYLSKLSYIPFRWRLFELLKTIRRVLTYVILSTNPWRSVRLIAKAIFDGVRGKLGSLNGVA
jgi:rhamnosyltransferase